MMLQRASQPLRNETSKSEHALPLDHDCRILGGWVLTMVRKGKKRRISNLQVKPPKSDGERPFGVLEGGDGVSVGEELLSVDANDAAPDGDALGGGLTVFSDADHDRHWVQTAPLL